MQKKKIASTGNKTTLLTRLRASGLRTALSTNSARAVPGEQTSQDQNLQDTTPTLSRDHAVNDANDTSFSEWQYDTGIDSGVHHRWLEGNR